MENLYELFINMVTRLAKAGKAIRDSLTDQGCHIIHMTLGIAGELKEIRSAMLRGDRANLIEELGDYEFYLEGICQGIGAEQGWSGKPGVEFQHLNLDKFFDELQRQTGIMVDTVKRIHIMNKPGWGDEKIAEAAHGIRMCLDGFYEANAYHITQDEVIEGNRKKLETGDKPRYAEGTYSDAAANARADKDGQEETHE